MPRRTSWFRTLSASVIAIGTLLAAGAAFVPTVVLAVDNSLPTPPMLPCGSSPGAVNECHTYDELQKLQKKPQNAIILAAVMAALNAMTYATQKMATATANFLLNGGKGGLAAYYPTTFKGFLQDVGTSALNSFVTDLNDYVQVSTGLNICAPTGLQAFDLQLSVGVQNGLWPQKTIDCTFQQFTKSFETSVQTLENTDVLDYVKTNARTDRSDLGIALTLQNQVLYQKERFLDAATLDRQEGKGLAPIADYITGNIKTPAQVAQATLNETNPVKLSQMASNLNISTIASNAFNIGFEQLPAIFGSTFLNTLAVGGLNALQNAFAPKQSGGNVTTAQLLNPFAQSSAEPKAAVTSAYTDVITPNLLSTDDQDFVQELSSCTTPRGLWSCSMDDSFAAGLRAVDQNGAMTVARAMGLNASGQSFAFLHPDWELIPEAETKDNQDPGCYQRAYCASNLAKMRFARIIPVGWELAANSPFNTKRNGHYITLGEVVRGFSDCDPTNPVADQAHPWCHLIDPSWVLTAPQFKCQIKGYSDTVLGGDYPIRQQECSDVVSCLQRDDTGKCVGGYGYCLSEKTVWRFDADACLERYASCRTYQARNKDQVFGGAISADSFGGKSVSFIRNTIDYGSCTANSVGCTYYATTHDTTTSTTGAWVGSITPWKDASGSAPASGPVINGPRVYFDAQAQTCDAKDDGCTRVLKIEDGRSALNLVQNGSFEDASGTVPGTWISSGTAPQTETTDSYLGNTGIISKGSGSLTQQVSVAPLRNYVVSFYAQVPSTVTGKHNAQVKVTLKKKDGATDVSTSNFYRSTDCAVTGNAAMAASATDLSSAWTRFACSFVTNSDAAYANIDVSGDVDSEIDGVQLEEGSSPTLFVDGANEQLKDDHLKLAPEELGCTGAATDRAECAQYARVCQQADAGCQGYTSVGGTDPTEIPASLSYDDTCPSACVGYAEYHKLPSAFDLVHDPVNSALDDPKDDTVADFIPSTGGQCTAQDVGCEVFTNIESAAAGGEKTQAFKYVRACEKPSDNSTTYFTWEGSETTGYQLRTWSLMSDNTLSPAPPKTLLKAGPEGFVKDPIACNESSWKAGIDPDCRQFYDEKGNVFYRYFSQTVVSSPDCQNYRKDNSDFDDCTKTGGAYNSTTKECDYAILAAESTTCQASVAACRAYIGTTGRNAATILHAAFDATATTTNPLTAPSGVSIALSTEALTVGDHSVKLALTTGSELQAALPFTSASGSLYTISFWAKTTDGKHASAVVTMDGNVVGTFVPLTDWSRFEIGPFTSQNAPNSVIQFRNLPNVTYIDEIAIQRQQDIVFVKKDSWSTPGVCDETSTGIPQAQAMLGCRAYTDRNGNTVDVREFSHLCRTASIGCTAYVDTRNSQNSFAQSFTLTGYDPAKLTKPYDSLYSGTVTVTRPADRYVYVIDDPAAHCDASAESCRAFGKPNFMPDGTLSTSTPFTTVYLKDDITKYVDSTGEPNMLCRPSELFCEQFTSQTPQGSIMSYFRDPSQHTCEWRDKVSIAGKEYSGWFVQGVSTPQPCYPNKLSTGATYLSEFSAANGYQGWTDSCPVDQAECTEFRDPNDHTDPVHADGKPYFFINNQKIDQQSCNGQVDLLSGCVLFRDTTNSQLLYSTLATYAKSKAENDAPQGPIDCQSDPTNKYCDLGKTCQNVQMNLCTTSAGATSCVALPAGDPEYTDLKNIPGKTCTTDADCTNGKHVSGTCVQNSQKNDSNTVIKVKLDRDCSTWLGCSSGETVYDSSQGKYVDLCTNLAVCDQSLGSNAGQFCAHYVDRSTRPTTVDPNRDNVLVQGGFISGANYSTRVIGFGKPDYSGYVLPNHYQIADYVTRRVGYELLSNRPESIRDKFYSDYRVVARSPLCKPESAKELCWDGVDNNCNGLIDEGCPGVTTSTAKLGDEAIRFKDPLYPFLNLCQDPKTKQVGYYVGDSSGNPTENPEYCYFAIDTPYSQNLADLTGDGSANPNNAQHLYDIFAQSQNPGLDPQLTNAFPPPECRANPDSTSPFPNKFVKEWNFVSDPPTPKTYVDGYAGASYCEYGEDCSCTYRKVTYGATSKYYAPYGGTPPSGICSGGSRDGQSCVPDLQTTNGSSDFFNGSATTTVNTTNANQTCGPSGTCQPIQAVSLIRGIFGQCLERDASRTIGSKDDTACLVWNPAPLLFGKDDVYHYQPTAGYTPPPNAGEYYCVAGAKPPKSIQPPASVDWFHTPGSMDDYKFFYSTDFVQAAECLIGSPGDFFATGCHGNNAPFIDGASADGGDMGNACTHETPGWLKRLFGNSGQASDPTAGRWIMTGRGSDKSYAEYFIGLKPNAWYQWLTGDTSDSNCDFKSDPYTCQDQQILDSLNERNFSSFTWSPISNPAALIGCGYSQAWVDNVAPDGGDYGSSDKVSAADAAWRQAFMSVFNGVMTSNSQDYLRTADGSQLQKVPCFFQKDEGTDGSGSCYVKFWQIGYRDQGQDEFKMQWSDYGGSKRFGGQSSIYYEQSQGSKPYFAIRAVFEDTSQIDNSQDPDPTVMPPSGNKLTGPFRFIGWWVTAAAPGTQSEQAIYMDLTIGHADICKEVAQVVSPSTRDSTPFQDRVWQNSGYNIPMLGYAYASLNAPFGSAMHTRAIGLDPLFQTHGEMPGVKSALKPPTFIASGLEYTMGTTIPAANWAWLTNVFARVYRIYHYYDQAVSKDSYACVYGPKFGNWCPTPGTDHAAAAGVSQRYCGYNGTCNGPLVQTSSKSMGLCNSLSGVNAGLTCSSDVNDQLTGYHVCHNAPVQNKGGVLTPLYRACKATGSWHVLPDGNWQNGAKPGISKAEAVKQGAFQCDRGTVRIPTTFDESVQNNIEPFCSTPMDNSPECPQQVDGGTATVSEDLVSTCDATTRHCTNGFEQAACNPANGNNDCVFGFAQWWGSPNANMKPSSYTTWYGSPPGALPLYHSGNTIKRGGLSLWYGYAVYGYDQTIEPWWNYFSSPISGLSQYNPGTGDAVYAAYLAGKVTVGDKTIPEDIGGNTFGGGAFVTTLSDTMVQRFPGAYAAGYTTDGKPMYIPAHCERAPEDDAALQTWITRTCVASGGTLDSCAWQADRPYAANTYDHVSKLASIYTSTYTSSPTQRYYGDPSRPWKFATCNGGEFDGRTCMSDQECQLQGADAAAKVAQSAFYCQPVSKSDGTPNTGTVAGFTFSCLDSSGDPKSTDLNTDNNLCTHNAGYFPRADLCGNDPYRPECLTSVTQNDQYAINPLKPNSLPPTDVTPGLYTPSYLASKINSEYGLTDPTEISDLSGSQYGYVSYYTPRPPTVAAPDTSRQCPSSGSCPIARVNAFDLENQTEGTISETGGQSVATMRFYGWTADNQAPLKDMWIDWGDGSVQEIHDARIKNKKPFCGGTSECQLVPGLTCNTDSDCPPAGGKCVPVGYCRAKPNVQCSTDDDCNIAPTAGTPKDRCQIRTTFGNSTDDCEANYFEFTHAYTCAADARNGNKCQSTKYCSRNNAHACTKDSDCGPTDTCVSNLAPPGGCFDDTTVSCRFTPRILLKDNWGWCTGECRVQTSGGKLAGGFKSSTSPGTGNTILLSNGGCYDGSHTYLNTDSKQPFSTTYGTTAGTNMCDPASTDAVHSPWVVYQGSYSLGIVQ